MTRPPNPRPESTEQAKEIAYYSQLLQGWIQNRMERDKAVLTLSAAGIGLLATLLTTVGITHLWGYLLYIAAALSFLLAILCTLRIYRLNSDHIVSALRDPKAGSRALRWYDKISFVAFMAGAALSFITALSSAYYHQLNPPGGKSMGEKVQRNDSLEGITNLNPTGTLKKSLEGISNLNPQNVQMPVPPVQQEGGSQTTSGPSSAGGTDKK